MRESATLLMDPILEQLRADLNYRCIGYIVHFSTRHHREIPTLVMPIANRVWLDHFDITHL